MKILLFRLTIYKINCIINETKLNISETGVVRHKRKVGAIPTRSRHCNDE